MIQKVLENLDKILLVIGAATVLFWPQIKAALAFVKTHATPDGQRSAWVSDILALQQTLEENGYANASGLLGQTAVSLIEHPNPDEEEEE